MTTQRISQTIFKTLALTAALWLAVAPAYGASKEMIQLQTQVQLLARLVDDAADPAAALAAPRWVVDPGDFSVRIEDRFPAAVVAGLRRRGRRLTVLGPWEDCMGHAHVIRVDRDGLTAASDPRSEGLAAGF